jgi:DNA-binding NarL/FixJ family response regulator
MVRVLMGDFGAMVRVGLEAILADQQVEVVQVNGQDLLTRVIEAVPHVVVIDLDRVDSDELARQLCTHYPSLTVVACSSAHPTMRVFPPFHHGESYTSRLDADMLRRLVRA